MPSKLLSCFIPTFCNAGSRASVWSCRFHRRLLQRQREVRWFSRAHTSILLFLSLSSRSTVAAKCSEFDDCIRKGVIEYNSREEMEDAIRKLDNTRVGDRGENLIRVYKVCGVASVAFVLRVDLDFSGVLLRACGVRGAPLVQRNWGCLWCGLLVPATFPSNPIAGGRSARFPPSPWTFSLPPWWPWQIGLSSWWPRRRSLKVAPPPPHPVTPVSGTAGCSWRSVISRRFQRTLSLPRLVSRVVHCTLDAVLILTLPSINATNRLSEFVPLGSLKCGLIANPKLQVMGSTAFLIVPRCSS